MKDKRVLIFVGIILTGAIVVASMWLLFYLRESKYPTLPMYGTLPSFKLAESSGRTVSSEDLAGQVWVVDFIFTRCASACPLMSSRMKDIQSALNGIPDVKLVSISVDPTYDTPEVLSAYAKKYGALPDQWLFLTGEADAIQKLVRNGFLLAVDTGTPDNPIIHSQKFVLIDKKGRVRGYYDGESPALGMQILRGVASLRKERH